MANGRYASLVEAWKATLLEMAPEPYDVSEVIRRKKVEANIRDARRHLAQAARRNVRSEQANG